jgi:hypothetical protein
MSELISYLLKHGTTQLSIPRILRTSSLSQWHSLVSDTHSVQIDVLFTLCYEGTAIYAYCILDNYITYTTFTNLTFSIDGVQVGDFSYNPDGSDTYVYDVLVYANTSIPNGNHTFGLHVPQGANASLVLFDYIQYT